MKPKPTYEQMQRLAAMLSAEDKRQIAAKFKVKMPSVYGLFQAARWPEGWEDMVHFAKRIIKYKAKQI